MTSPDWLPQYEPCNLCSHGFIITPERAIKCECRQKFESYLYNLYFLKNANLITDHSSKSQVEFLFNYKLKDYRGKDEKGNLDKIEKYALNVSNKYGSHNLFFHGTYGTQKSTLARYIGKEWIKSNKKVYYIIANDLLTIISDDRKEELKEKSEQILLSDLVIIDEFEDSKIVLYKESQWQMRHFLSWIKNRLENIKKSTIFISNSPPNNLGDCFKGSIQDLIERETCNGVILFEDKYSVHKEKIDLNKIWE